MSKFFILLFLIGSTLGLPANKASDDDQKKLINTPVICANGEEAVNGFCKEEIVKRSAPEVQIVPECLIDCTIPGRDCPDGQEMDENGNCRDAWGRKKREVEAVVDTDCIIDCNIPNKCPPGQAPDENGNCRDEWPKQAEEISLTRALKPKKKSEDSKSVKVVAASAAAAKTKAAAAKAGKTFLLIKKKKKFMKKPTTAAPEAEQPAPEPPFFPDPPPFIPDPPDFPEPEEEEESNSISCESGDCDQKQDLGRNVKSKQPKKLKIINEGDTWGNWFNSGEDEDGYSYEQFEVDDSDAWDDEFEDNEPIQIDDELLEKLIEMKIKAMMQMGKEYGPLIAQMMVKNYEEEQEKIKKKQRS